MAESFASKLMQTELHFGCGIFLGGSISGREVSQFSQAHLLPGLNRFWPSGRRRPSVRRTPGSDRFALVAARRLNPLAAVLSRVVSSQPLRYGRSLHGRDRTDGRTLRALTPRGVQLRLQSHANSLRPRARFLQIEAVACREELENSAAMTADPRLHARPVCVRTDVFLQIGRSSGQRRNSNSVRALSTAPAGTWELTDLVRSYSRKRMTRYRPARNGATLELRIQRQREQR